MKRAGLMLVALCLVSTAAAREFRDSDDASATSHNADLAQGTWEQFGTPLMDFLKARDIGYNNYHRQAVINAWTGAALVGTDMYFTGGGHADGSINAVFKLDLTSGEWSVFDPHKDHDAVDEKTGVSYPSGKFGSAHTYDGVVYAAVTNSIFFWGTPWYAPMNKDMFWGKGGWELDLDTKEWTHRGPMGDLASAYDSKRGLITYFDGFGNFRTFDPRTGKSLGKTKVGTRPIRHDFSFVYDAGRDVYWLHSRVGLHRVGIGKNGLVWDWTFMGQGRPDGSWGMDLGPDGNLYFWNGARKITVYDVAADTWMDHDYSRGPSAEHDKVFSKWRYVPILQVFVGYNNPHKAPWFWRPVKRNRP